MREERERQRNKAQFRIIAVVILAIASIIAEWTEAATSAVVINSPTNGSIVSGTVNITLTVGATVPRAQVYVDSKPQAATPPNTIAWDSSRVPDGWHIVTAKAYDKSNQLIGVTSASVFVWATAKPAPGSMAYYVDPAGNDSNAGTSQSKPWRTVARVNAARLRAGDVVYFRRNGIWRETLQPAAGGGPGYPIIFSAYASGSRPIITGSDLVTGWSPSGGIYRAALAQQPYNVYIDGGPRWGLLRACCTAGTSCAATGKCAIGPMKAGSWSWNPAQSRLSVWLADGSNPAAHTVEAATRIYGFRLVANGGEKSNVAVEQLTFRRTGGYGVYLYSGAAGGRGLAGVEIRNTTVQQTGTGQVDSGSYYNGIHYSQGAELATSPRFINNVISYSGGHGNAINCQNADGAKIIGNRADHFNHHGFDTKSSSSVLIENNVAHDSSEANGIYQEYCARGSILRNVLYNLSGSVSGRGSGIQIDVGSTAARVINNSIKNVRTGIYIANSASVVNNAIAQASRAAVAAANGGVFSHNNWGASPAFYLRGTRLTFLQWQSSTGEVGDIAVNPLWTAPSGGNFALLPNSPCIDAGTRVGLPFNGSDPDIGAVESP
jgi:hypothetical protein